MNISESGLDFIKRQESPDGIAELNAYQDKKGVWTIGWGHTGPEVKADLVIDIAQAEVYLLADLETTEKCIRNSVSVNLTQGQHDALCSFVFNLGCMALRNSTLLRRLNEGDDVAAAAEFKKWDHIHVDGKLVELADLTKRRQAEAEMFLT